MARENSCEREAVWGRNVEEKRELGVKSGTYENEKDMDLTYGLRMLVSAR